MKTYIFKHFYSHYLVLLTMVPRNMRQREGAPMFFWGSWLEKLFTVPNNYQVTQELIGKKNEKCYGPQVKTDNISQLKNGTIPTTFG